jgi:hypothetical protein
MISDKPKFLSADDVSTGKKLHRELQILMGKRLALGNRALIDRKRRAEAKYLASDRTDANLANFRKESQEVEFLQANYKLRRVAEADVNTFFSSEAVPFARRILERGLELARESLLRVTADENLRCQELTGGPVSFSDVISAAERPVNFFELTLRRISADNALTAHELESFFEALPEMVVADSSNGASPEE